MRVYATWEAPIAHGMYRLSRQTTEIFSRYICLWSAFNNIYVTLCDENPDTKRIELVSDGFGGIRYDSVFGIPMPKTHTVSEKNMIKACHREMSNDLRVRLCCHPNVQCFAMRVPRWGHREILQDSNGLKLNGVINIGRTFDEDHPVWSPIDEEAYNKCKDGTNSPQDISLLSEQILLMLYTIRNNTVHGGKRVDDASDRLVIEKAIPLLEMIVDAFLGA